MDFANERYVRLYVRDTTGWKLLRWEGQAVWTLLYRKADRAGVIGLDGLEPGDAAALHCDIPEDIAHTGMQRCLDRGWIVLDGDRLVFPKFIEANETPMSDAQRARESRGKRAALSQNVTAPSQNVTECHAESHAVTPRHTASLLTTPSRADLLTTPTTQSAREAFNVRPLVKHDPAPAAAGAAWLAKATGKEPFPISGRWAEALATIAAKPEHERAAAEQILAAQAAQTTGIVNPRHVVDYWHLYAQGKAPGTKHHRAALAAPEPVSDWRKDPEVIARIAKCKALKDAGDLDEYESAKFAAEQYIAAVQDQHERAARARQA